jgi:hypothetical protein
MMRESISSCDPGRRIGARVQPRSRPFPARLHPLPPEASTAAASSQEADPVSAHPHSGVTGTGLCPRRTPPCRAACPGHQGSARRQAPERASAMRRTSPRSTPCGAHPGRSPRCGAGGAMRRRIRIPERGFLRRPGGLDMRPGAGQGQVHASARRCGGCVHPPMRRRQGGVYLRPAKAGAPRQTAQRSGNGSPRSRCTSGCWPPGPSHRAARSADAGVYARRPGSFRRAAVHPCTRRHMPRRGHGPGGSSIHTDVETVRAGIRG